MMSVEVKQTLERGFDIAMATRDIRLLTINKLASLATGQGQEQSSQVKVEGHTTKDTPGISQLDVLPTDLIVPLNEGKCGRTRLYVIHPIEGTFVLQLLVLEHLQKHYTNNKIQLTKYQK